MNAPGSLLPDVPENPDAPCNICGKGWPYHYDACAYVATAEERDRFARALRDCIAAAGMPDAADGCRRIIRIATGALEVPDFTTPGDDFGA